MRFKISGIGKIGDSQIEMNGITVIAGENNTGKSTFGKTLYCMFNAFCNAKLMIRSERIDDLHRVIYDVGLTPYAMAELLKTLVMEIEHTTIEEFSEDDVKKMIMDAVTELSTEESENAELIDNIKRSLAVSNEEIQKIVINRYFEQEFESNINHVNRLNSIGNVSICIQGKNISLNIKDNKPNDFADSVGIRHKAIYIDTPFVMDDIKKIHYSETVFKNHAMMDYNHRHDLRRRLVKERSNNTVIEEAIMNKKISGVLSNISSVIDGEFIEDGRKIMFMEKGLKKPIPLSDISAGFKTFLIIKRLLELGEIKERDVLILDEPEIHLNPSWQLQFAEILVLLQKEFNLTILLTTHSPYFLYAVEVYGKKHGIKERINFYFAENDGDVSNVREVTSDIDVIYQQLAEPFQKLENVAYGD